MAVMTVLEIEDIGLAPDLSMPEPAEVGAHAGAHADAEVDVHADCARVWCSFSGGPARVLDGFCECCGACDHDCL